MKIGIDARMYGPLVGGGGLGRYVEQLVTQLQAMDHKNRYVLFLKKENFDACEITNPNFEKRLADIHWYTWKEQVLLGPMMDREKLDLIHFPHWNVPLNIRTPFVTTIHDLILLEEPKSAKATTRSPLVYAVKYTAYRRVLRNAVREAKRIIAPSVYTKLSILKHFPNTSEENIDVIYEGVTPLQTKAGAKRAQHPPKPYLLYVGNAYPHKNLEFLIDGFEQFSKEHLEVQLVLAGKHNVFYKNLLKHIRNSNVADRTHFIDGPTDNELASLFQHAHAYVFPSRIEGFGLPPLEAMQAGVPVASSNATCMPEILGDAAEYFSPTNQDELLSALETITSNKKRREELIQNGNEQLKNYSWESMTHAINTLYESCARS